MLSEDSGWNCPGSLWSSSMETEALFCGKERWEGWAHLMAGVLSDCSLWQVRRASWCKAMSSPRCSAAVGYSCTCNCYMPQEAAQEGWALSSHCPWCSLCPWARCVGSVYTSKQWSIKGSHLETEEVEDKELMFTSHKHKSSPGWGVFPKKGLVWSIVLNIREAEAQ